MYASSLNVKSSPFDQKFFKVNESAVASSQVSWLQSPSREKKQNNKVLPNTWRPATFQYHLAGRTKGERREAAFLNVLYR